jgi:hypothetical protein
MAKRSPDAIDDEAEQDHDHAGEPDKVRPQLRRGVPGEVLHVTRRLPMSRDVGKPADDEDHEAYVNEERQGKEPGASAF